MKIPFSWLNTFIHLTDLPQDIAHKLTFLGIEVEDIETLSFSFENVVVGKVLKVEKHPNADKLKVATVTEGTNEFQVVCGAKNCKEGLLVAFAPIGARIKDPEGNELVIKKVSLRGVESFGMLCSGKELGLTDDHEGILELPQEFSVGSDFAKVLEDVVFDLSLTPNLAHCWSVLGVARELSAKLDKPYKKVKIEVKESQDFSTKDYVDISVEEKDKCPRYGARIIRNVKVGPSPFWLQRRLRLCGIRSVNNVVDITNFVMMELGHPLHAFDYDKLEGQKIKVKCADEGDVFEALDNQKYTLSKETLMICDSNKPIAIAGVMGGKNSEVDNQTQHILLESAYFTPKEVRRSSKKYGISSDSSKRFERGTDPNNVIKALDRAAMLIQEICGGEVAKDIIDKKEKEFHPKKVSCRLDRICQMLGQTFSFGEVGDIFRRLEFSYQSDDQNVFTVEIPTYRVDINQEIDLIEEIARIYGYESFSSQKAYYQTSDIPHSPIYLFEKETRQRLISLGLQELITCDLIGPKDIDLLKEKTVSQQSLVKVLNPTSKEQSILRPSLLPGLLGVVKYNFDRQNKHLHGFELGRIHLRKEKGFCEQLVAGIVMVGNREPISWDKPASEVDFFDLKGIVESYFSHLRIQGVQFEKSNHATLHPGRQASILLGSLNVGSVGEVHPEIQRLLGVEKRIYVAEINLHDVIQCLPEKPQMQKLSQYPASERDWTITLEESVPIKAVFEAIEKAKTTFLEKALLLYIYRDEKIGKNKKNITLRFTFRDWEKTISQEVVDKEFEQLTKKVTQQLGNVVFK